MPAAGVLVLRNARPWEGGAQVVCDFALQAGRVLARGEPGTLAQAAREADLEGRLLLPGLVNVHDHLDLSTFPPLGRPPYRSADEWAESVGEGGEAVRPALAVPLVERFFLGGLRNLLAGATAVAHHGAFHRSLGREEFPVRVLARYGFAHSPSRTPKLRRTYRTTDRRIPWLVHVAEGTDERSRAELEALVAAGVLRQNTVLIHGIGLRPEDGPRLAAARACLVWCPEANRRLYGATAPAAELRAAGVRIGLGSDSPATGARDPASNLAAARREGVFADDDLIEIATRESAEVARLPVGGFGPGAPADFAAVESLERLLEGDRRAVALAVVAGRPLYGESALLEALGVASRPILLDGAARALEAGLARRAAAALGKHGNRAAVPWLAGVSFGK